MDVPQTTARMCLFYFYSSISTVVYGFDEITYLISIEGVRYFSFSLGN